MAKFGEAHLETALLPVCEAAPQEAIGAPQSSTLSAINAATLAHIQAYDDLAAARRELVRSVGPSSVRH